MGAIRRTDCVFIGNELKKVKKISLPWTKISKCYEENGVQSPFTYTFTENGLDTENVRRAGPQWGTAL